MRTTLTPAFTSAKMRHMFDLVRNCAAQSTDFLLETFFPAVGCEMTMEMKDFYSRVTNDTVRMCDNSLNFIFQSIFPHHR